MSVCEIRIPTYKRPAWLKRALNSLIVQDFSDWRAIVMDDSPDCEAKDVVFGLRDNRIIYWQNPHRLGGAANLDRAFQSKSFLGSTWACALEDDNWLMPSFLRKNIRALDTHRVGLILRNQTIHVQEKNGSAVTTRTTRGEWFTERQYDPIELHAHLFFFEGVSNGGLFWDTSIPSNLYVGPSVNDSGLQEYCRTLQIREAVYFKAEPLCVWSEMSPELIFRSSISTRSVTRGLQSLIQYLIRKYNKEIIELAKTLSSRLLLEERFEMSLLDALYTDYDFQAITKVQALKRYLRSYAKFKCIADPLSDYFSVLDGA